MNVFGFSISLVRTNVYRWLRKNIVEYVWLNRIFYFICVILEGLKPDYKLRNSVLVFIISWKIWAIRCNSGQSEIAHIKVYMSISPFVLMTFKTNSSFNEFTQRIHVLLFYSSFLFMQYSNWKCKSYESILIWSKLINAKCDIFYLSWCSVYERKICFIRTVKKHNLIAY